MSDCEESEEGEEGDTSCECCASCGIAELDDVKLVPCDGCDLVRYCSDECQRDHKPAHEEDCKKRAAELRDGLLFKQPESSHLGDCPICMVPLPFDIKKYSLAGCCSKFICNGCRYASIQRELEMRLQPSCPFCRQALPRTDEESVKRNMKRIEANDPVAIFQQGAMQYQQGNYARAFKYFTKATELGNVALAHYELSNQYRWGDGVEKDWGKYKHHLEEAAIGGHPGARHNLGAYEWNNGNPERAIKHLIIAATQGEGRSIKELTKCFKGGFVEKDDLAAALRAHKAAVDATKSEQREAAEEYYKSN